MPPGRSCPFRPKCRRIPLRQNIGHREAGKHVRDDTDSGKEIQIGRRPGILLEKHMRRIQGGQCCRRPGLQQTRRLPAYPQGWLMGSSKGAPGKRRGHQCDSASRSTGGDRRGQSGAGKPYMHNRPLLQKGRHMASQAHLVVSDELYEPYRPCTADRGGHHKSGMGGEIQPSAVPQEHIPFHKGSVRIGTRIGQDISLCRSTTAELDCHEK